MFDITTLSVFIAAALLLLITPGPAVLYIVARSIDQGRMAGIVSALGVGVGSLVHVIAAALGLSALLVSSAVAFNIVKYLGAAYLIYLGVRKFMESDTISEDQVVTHKRLIDIFNQGVVVNLLNPKTALFFFAFLPQFVNTGQGSIVMQIMVLGTIFIVLGILSDGVYAVLAGALRGWLKKQGQFFKAQRYFAGTVFIALGITTALTGTKK